MSEPPSSQIADQHPSDEGRHPNYHNGGYNNRPTATHSPQTQSHRPPYYEGHPYPGYPPPDTNPPLPDRYPPILGDMPGPQPYPHYPSYPPPQQPSSLTPHEMSSYSNPPYPPALPGYPLPQQPLYPPRAPHAPFYDQYSPSPYPPAEPKIYPPSHISPGVSPHHSAHSSPQPSHAERPSSTYLPPLPPRDPPGDRPTSPTRYPPRPSTSEGRYPPLGRPTSPAGYPPVTTEGRYPQPPDYIPTSSPAYWPPRDGTQLPSTSSYPPSMDPVYPSGLGTPTPTVAPLYPPQYPPRKSNSNTLQQETNMPPRSTGTTPMPMVMSMPMPMPISGSNRYQAFHPSIPYPPPGYARPASQDFISRFRSSTVHGSAALEDEEAKKDLREKLLRRKDSSSSKNHGDSSDEEEEIRHHHHHRPQHHHHHQMTKPEAAVQSEMESAAAELEAMVAYPTIQSTDPALLSVIGKMFAKQIKQVVGLRVLSFTDEYPEAFTGQEALDTMYELLQGRYHGDEHVRDYCLSLLTALVNYKPDRFMEPVDLPRRSKTIMVHGQADETFQIKNIHVKGVFTPLTKCYVNGCEPGGGGCYAPRCPNKPDVRDQEIEVQDSLARSVSQRTIPHTEDMHVSESWGQRMDPDFYKSLDSKERDRQEAINELIYSEEQYLKDLELLRDAIIKPMQDSKVIPETEWDIFSKNVFNNYEELHYLSTRLFQDLYDRYTEHEQECIPGIGDIMLKHFARFRDPYGLYVPNVSLAEYIVADLKKSNADFGQFLQLRQADPGLNKQPFRHYLIRPALRLPRYPLLLNAIIKKTKEDDPEREVLKECLRMITEIAGFCDQLSASVKTRVEILLLNNALTCRQGEFYDLKLTDPRRKIYYRGDLRLDNWGPEVTEKIVHVIIFDHIVLLTKPRETSENTEYKIWRRPIPLQMIHIQGADNDFNLPSQLSLTNNSTYNTLRPALTMRSNGNTMLVLTNPGRHGETYNLQCGSVQEKEEWVFAFKQARADLKNQVDAFNVVSMESTHFSRDSGVLATTPFEATNGRKMLAIGSSDGLYFKEGEGKPRHIVALTNVTQIGVLQKYQIILVLADKNLIAYPLDLLTATNRPIVPQDHAQRINDRVQFFQIGVTNGMDLVVYARQKAVSAVFTALHPVRNITSSETTSRGFGGFRANFFSGRTNSPWFSTFKEFSVGAQAVNIHFLKSRFAVVCDKAFEIIDPNDLSSARSIPFEDDPKFNFLETRKDGLRPLAMYRVHDKFLLCYNKFAFYVNNRNQSLVPRDKTSSLLCEWESNPDNIVYHHPYVLAFDQRFIEVRHVETGDLVQMIPGNDCHLTYYNGNGNSGGLPIIHGCITHARNASKQDVFFLEPNKRMEMGEAAEQ